MRFANLNRNMWIVAVAVLALVLFTACAPASDSGDPGAAEPTAEPTEESIVEPTEEPEVEPTPTEEAEAAATPEATPAPDGEGMDLVGSRWNLVMLGEEEPLPDSSITLDFTEDELGGVAGCNHYGGPYTLENDAFSVGEIFRTEMACEGLMDQEDLYLEMLRAAESLTVEEETLTIHTGQGDLVYEPAEDVALEGREWTLSGIAEGDAVGSMWVDADITATFEDGVMAGSAGGNSYTADYTLDGNTLSLGDVIRTEMACEEEERMQREDTFLAALENVTAYEIVRETLTLMDDDGNMVMSFTVSDDGVEAGSADGRTAA